MRREMLVRRRGVPPGEAARAGEAAAVLLSGCPEVRIARNIALYAARADELPTRPLFEALRAQGKRLFLPRVTTGEPLAFFAVEQWGDLRVGSYGLLEPPTLSATARVGELDLVIAPGLAFDRAGRRLGHGMGYYDRTFPVDCAETGSILLGLGYEFQIVPEVPTSPRDRGMDGLATEQRVFWIGREAS